MTPPDDRYPLDNPLITMTCDYLSDTIISNAGAVTQEMGDEVMEMMRSIDPTESLHAAHIRDTLRDNTDWSPTP